MKISKENFFAIGSSLKISDEQVKAFWMGFEKMDETPESTPFAKSLFYLGAMVIISAMTWFVHLGWEWFGGGGIFLIAIFYAMAFTLAGALSWDKKGLRIPSGILITIAVCMIPLAIYGLETYFNIWPAEYLEYKDVYQWIRGSWIFLEIGTIFAGIVALCFFPFPFLIVPIFFATWFLAIDLLVLMTKDDSNWEQKYWVSLCFGLVWMTIGFFSDRNNKKDYGFWSYLFGTAAFWISLNYLVWDRSEFILFIYLVINLLMMCFSIFLRRNILMILGALGVFGYLGHLAYNIFENSLLFPFVLSAIGLLIIYLGVLYQRNMGWIEKNIFKRIPSSIRDFLDNGKDD